MLNSFLVSLDESDFDEQILPYASALAQSADVALYLAHVHVPYPPTQFLTTQLVWEGVGVDMWQYDEQDKKEEQGYLEETAKRVGKELGKTVTPALLFGEVPAAVDEYAKAHGVGLVVVGAHRHRGLLGLGSETVEDALLHHTDLPVLIVPPEAEFGVPCRPEPFRLHHARWCVSRRCTPGPISLSGPSPRPGGPFPHDD